MHKDYSLKREEIIRRLTGQMFQHRDTLGLQQKEVAHFLNKSDKTYQRWESTGNGLSDIFDLLTIFRVLQFSTTEIIDVLGLPPLTLNEVKGLYQDEETIRGIRENTVYSFISKECSRMQTNTIEKLLCVLLKEYLKKKGYAM